ncbi:hypothetical protein U9M48_043899 [Paspalum notatum var. saurae]|uniref:Uncharacterized protein n=1 Tax=Paspalum notatum var. saurae TaxID=547442 RepID=A0AAQ3XJ06_PASNO
MRLLRKPYQTVPKKMAHAAELPRSQRRFLYREPEPPKGGFSRLRGTLPSLPFILTAAAAPGTEPLRGAAQAAGARRMHGGPLASFAALTPSAASGPTRPPLHTDSLHHAGPHRRSDPSTAPRRPLGHANGRRAPPPRWAPGLPLRRAPHKPSRRATAELACRAGDEFVGERDGRCLWLGEDK